MPRMTQLPAGFQGKLRKRTKTKMTIFKRRMSHGCDLKKSGCSSSCPLSRTKATQLCVCVSVRLSDGLCVWLSHLPRCDATEGDGIKRARQKSRENYTLAEQHTAKIRVILFHSASSTHARLARAFNRLGTARLLPYTTASRLLLLPSAALSPRLTSC